MTYLQFHLVFLLPPLLLLSLLLYYQAARPGPADGAQWRARAVWGLPLLTIIALVYTTPWDNYLVYRGIWYYGVDRVIGTIGYVPVEEYLFFILQPFLTGLWLLVLLNRTERGGDPHATGPSRRTGGVRLAVAIAYGTAAAAGAIMLFSERTLYLGLILAWAAPVLLGQWLLAGRAALARWRVTLAAIVVPTLYLWAADRIAIGAGIWSISPDYTTGAHIVGLPIEEAAFFLVTNILVVQGLVLFLFPDEVRMPGVPAARRQRQVHG